MTEQKDARRTPVLKRVFYDLKLYQWLVIAAVLLFISSLNALGALVKIDGKNVEVIDFQIATGELLKSLIFGGASTGLFTLFLYFYPPTKAHIITKLKNVLWFSVLYLCGIIAYGALAQVLILNMAVPPLVAYPLIAVAVLYYSLLNYYLCLLDRIESRARFWEIFRFAVVGAIAAIFDFTLTSIIRFGGLLVSSYISLWLVTILAVLGGFSLGVVINYLCSISMVFKSQKSERDISRTPRGIFLFIALGAVGLLIGIGIEMILYNLMGISSAVTFVVRTLVVLIWNYISRKLFIFH